MHKIVYGVSAMGVKGLSKLLRDKHPELFNSTRTLSDYRGHRFAIDVSIFLYKFSYCKEPDDDTVFLEKFVTQYRMLQSYGIQAVYIFDGLGEHTGKERERAKRSVQTKRATELRENKITALTQSLQLISGVENGGSASVLDTNEEIVDAESVDVTPATGESSLPGIESDSSAKGGQACLDALFRIRQTEIEIQRLRMSVTDVKPIHSINLKVILTSNAIPFYEATGEAEKACAWLAKEGLVDVAVSEDYDTLVCGAPVLLRNLGSTKFPLLELKLDDILAALKLTYVEFVDFCILCGTDFNNSLPKIGPVNALKKIREHRCIEEVLRSESALASNAVVMETFTFLIARSKFMNDDYQLTNVFSKLDAVDEFFEDEYKMDVELETLYGQVIAT